MVFFATAKKKNIQNGLVEPHHASQEYAKKTMQIYANMFYLSTAIQPPPSSVVTFFQRKHALLRPADGFIGHGQGLVVMIHEVMAEVLALQVADCFSEHFVLWPVAKSGDILELS